jgi:hypothetical protein
MCESRSANAERHCQPFAVFGMPNTLGSGPHRSGVPRLRRWEAWRRIVEYVPAEDKRRPDQGHDSMGGHRRHLFGVPNILQFISPDGC